MAERAAGIVLAGGRSTRMGSPKATLEWHGSTLVRRAAGIVARVVDGPVVGVRAAGLELPPLPSEIEIVDDERENRGPLEGIAAGLRRIGARASVVFVAGVEHRVEQLLLGLEVVQQARRRHARSLGDLGE